MTPTDPPAPSLPEEGRHECGSPACEAVCVPFATSEEHNRECSCRAAAAASLPGEQGAPRFPSVSAEVAAGVPDALDWLAVNGGVFGVRFPGADWYSISRAVAAYGAECVEAARDARVKELEVAARNYLAVVTGAFVIVEADTRATAERLRLAELRLRALLDAAEPADSPLEAEVKK